MSMSRIELTNGSYLVVPGTATEVWNDLPDSTFDSAVVVLDLARKDHKAILQAKDIVCVWDMQPIPGQSATGSAART